MRTVTTRSNICLIALGVVVGSAATLLASYALHTYRSSKVVAVAYDSSSDSSSALMLGRLHVRLDDDTETIGRNASAAGLQLDPLDSSRHPELKRVRVYRQATADELATAADLLRGAPLGDRPWFGLRNTGFTLGYIDTFKGRVLGADRSVEQETLHERILLTPPGADSPQVRAALSLWEGLNNLRRFREVSPTADIPLDMVQLRSYQMVEPNMNWVEAVFRHGNRWVKLSISRDIGSALGFGSVSVREGIRDISKEKTIMDEIERQRTTK